MDSSFLLLAARSVRRQAKQLNDQLDGVRKSEDIEYVHRARVATRRLRAALRMFHACFGPRKVKRWRKEIRRAASELGEARDRDVQAVFLCEIMLKLASPECFPGMARLLARIEHEREQLHPKVCRAVGRLRGSGVIDEMIGGARRILGELDHDEVSPGSPFARQVSREHILRRLTKLESLSESLSHIEAKSQHHAMRIAAKRLRYTLELCNPVFEKRLDAAINAAKTLQTLLGDLHDCDVWQGRLDEFTAAERKRLTACFGNDRRFGRLAAGIDAFREELLARRGDLFVELGAVWSELIRGRIWDNLRQSVVAGEAAAETPALGPADKEPARRETAPV